MSPGQQILAARGVPSTPAPPLRAPGLILIPKSVESADAGAVFILREL